MHGHAAAWARCWCAALLVVGALGQGLVTDPSTLGASSAALRSQGAQFAAALQRAQQLRAAYSSHRGACSQRSGTLCGAMGVDSHSDHAALMLATSPQVYDARNPGHTGGFKPISPPLDQASCNACVAFALAAAAEAAVASALRTSVGQVSTPALSPRDAFFCSPQMTLVKRNCQDGWTLKEAIQQLIAKNRLFSSNCMPFVNLASLQSSGVCRPACSAQSVPGTFDYTWMEPLTTIEAVQAHIREWGGVLTRMWLPQEALRAFFKQNPRGVWRRPDPPITETIGHAVFVVGYDQANRYWVVKNSWGPAWGDGGFFRVGYGLLGLMDPYFTFGLTFKPAAWVNAPLHVPSVAKAPKAGCYTYITRAGDYVAGIAGMYGVAIDAFLNENAARIRDPTALLPPGLQLLVCNPSKPVTVGHHFCTTLVNKCSSDVYAAVLTLQGDHYTSHGFFSANASGGVEEICHDTVGAGQEPLVVAYYLIEGLNDAQAFPRTSQYMPVASDLAPWRNGTAEAWMCVAQRDSGFTIANTAPSCPAGDRGAAVQGWRVRQASKLTLCDAPPGMVVKKVCVTLRNTCDVDFDAALAVPTGAAITSRGWFSVPAAGSKHACIDVISKASDVNLLGYYFSEPETAPPKSVLLPDRVLPGPGGKAREQYCVDTVDGFTIVNVAGACAGSHRKQVEFVWAARADAFTVTCSADGAGDARLTADTEFWRYYVPPPGGSSCAAVAGAYKLSMPTYSSACNGTTCDRDMAVQVSPNCAAIWMDDANRGADVDVDVASFYIPGKSKPWRGEFVGFNKRGPLWAKRWRIPAGGDPPLPAVREKCGTNPGCIMSFTMLGWQ